jgi:hypothetical protein
MAETVEQPKIGDQIAAQRVAYQDRVKVEATEYKERIDRLQSFINGPEYNHVHDNEKGLLMAQLAQMQAVYQTFLQRIAIHKATT